MMIRQPGPFREASTKSITTADKDLFDWMDEHGKKPGDDLSEYFQED